MKRSFTIILNPISDNGNARKKISQIENFFNREKVDFRIILTEAVGHAISIAASCAKLPDRVIVAAGGDGTSNEVINGLMTGTGSIDSQPPVPETQKTLQLGVLPIGRGNDFAFGAGIPRDLSECMNLLLEGSLYPIDVGLVIGGDFPQGRYFGNGIGIGFDAIVGLEAARMKYLHGMSSYILAAMKKLVFFPKAPTVELCYHDRKKVVTPAMISIMNGRRMGGAFFMAPDGDMNDGVFNLSITHQGSRISSLYAMMLYMKGKQSSHRGTMMDYADKILLRALSGSMTAHADGETICIDGKKLEVMIVPSALQMITLRRRK